MRIIFFGTPFFSAKLLEYLLQNQIDIPLVVTRKDKPKGRSLELSKTPVKEVAEKFGIPCYQPEKVSDPESFEKLKAYEADLFVVAAFGEIVKQAILDLPKLAAINVHTSLLPKFRGAAPIQRAIIEGENKSGVTIMHMVRKMDAGGIICQEEVAIEPDETFGSLEEKLLSKSKKLLLDTIHAFATGKPKSKPQEDDLATYAAKIELEDCKIDWQQKASDIYNLIRGVNPYPGAWTEFKINKKPVTLKIWRAAAAERDKAEGSNILVENNRLFARAADKFLEILELQLPGKKKMAVRDWLRGARIESIDFN